MKEFLTVSINTIPHNELYLLLCVLNHTIPQASFNKKHPVIGTMPVCGSAHPYQRMHLFKCNNLICPTYLSDTITSARHSGEKV